MNKKVVSVLLVLVLGGGIGYYFYSKKSVPVGEESIELQEVGEDFLDDLDGMSTEMPSFEDDVEDKSPLIDTNAIEVDTLEMAV